MSTLASPTWRPAPSAEDRAVIATDESGVIQRLSPAAEQLLGYDSEELIGLSLRSLHVADELRARAGFGELGAVFARVRSGAVPFDRQRWTYVRGDSTYLPVNTTVSPVYGGDQEVVAFVVLLDVPDIVEPVVRAEADRPAPLVERGDHTSGVDHELRSPISVIMGYAEMLQNLDAGPLNEQQHTMLDKVEGSATRLLDVMQWVVRALPSAPRHTVGVARAAVDLVEVVDRCVDNLSARLHDQRLRLAVDLGSGPLVVEGSAPHLSVMVDHLLNNAVTFTPSHGLVSVTLTVDDGHCVLVVADSGRGIPRDELPQVFTGPSDFAAAPPGSIGGGLATAQAIASMHGGGIEVESCLGDGSDYVVRLPVVASDQGLSATG